jgi:hypothetical protein
MSAAAEAIVVATYSLADGTFQWYKHAYAQSITEGSRRALDAAVDAFGNVYATGYAAHTTIFDEGAQFFAQGISNTFIVKYDPAGAFTWVRVWSDSGLGGYDAGNGIVIDAGNNPIICGYFQGLSRIGSVRVLSSSNNLSECCVVRYSPDGDVLNAFSFGGQGADEANAIDLAPNGDIIVGGTFSQFVNSPLKLGTTLLPSAGGSDVFLARFRPDGVALGGITGGGPDDDFGFAACHGQQLVDGILGGAFFNSAVFTPHTLTSAGSLDAFLAYGTPVLSAVDEGAGGSGMRIWRSEAAVYVQPGTFDGPLYICVYDMQGRLVASCRVASGYGNIITVHTGAYKQQPLAVVVNSERQMVGSVLVR